MIKEKELKFFEKVLDIYAPSLWQVEEDDLDGEDDLRYALEKVFEDSSFEICSGASRLAIVFPEQDWVIKMNIDGHMMFREEYDEETCEYYYDDEDFIKEVLEEDYCKLEYDNYKKAEELGLEKFFAETIYLGNTRDGKRIWLQEKVIPVSDESLSRPVSENSKTKAKEMSKYIDKEWLGRCIDLYGEEKTREMLNFNNKINNDVHNGNYGFTIGDDEPKFLDYCGYYG